MVWGSVVSSTCGVWGGAAATNDFWMFCAIFYPCVHYASTASIIPNRTNLEGSKSIYCSLQRPQVGIIQKQPMFLEYWCWNNGNRTKTAFSCVTQMLQTSLFHYRTLQNEKSRPILNFARFDSLVCIVARSREKSRSLSLAPFLARSRSLSLSLTGLVMVNDICVQVGL